MSEKNNLFNRKTYQHFGINPQNLQDTKLHEQNRNQLCIQHSQPIQYLCFTCSNFLLCSQCITTSNHPQHDLKNLERSRQFFKRELQEWNSRLQLKSQILGGLNEQLRNTRAEIFEQAQSYKQKVALEFKQIIKHLEDQLVTILRSITEFSNECKRDYTDIANQIVNKQMELKEMIEDNYSKINQKSIEILAQHYHTKIASLDLHILEKEIAYYKQLIRDPVWGIQPGLLRNVYNSITKIKVTFHNQDSLINFQDEKNRQSFVKSVKKSKKDLKLNELNKMQRLGKTRNSNAHSVSPFLVTYTPKNLSKERGIPHKKSPGERTLLKKKKKSLSKMISLPASPSKDNQKEPQISPSVSNKNVFKKK